jgi:hypothetical protein
MPKHTSTDAKPLYDNAANIEWIEGEVAVAMMIAGLDPANIDTVTIDEIIAGILDVFDYGESMLTEDAIEGKNRYYIGSQAFIRKQQNKLTNVARRHWRELHLAKWLSENEY